MNVFVMELVLGYRWSVLWPVLCLHGAFIDWLMTFGISKVVTISVFLGININMNLNVSINIMFVISDNSDRNDTIWSFTAIKIKYCISTAFHGAAVNVYNLTEPFKDETVSVW